MNIPVVLFSVWLGCIDEAIASIHYSPEVKTIPETEKMREVGCKSQTQKITQDLIGITLKTIDD